MSDLLPCPFCEAALVWSHTYSEYHHPVAKCILSGHKFKKGMIGQWNRRALPAVQPDAREAALREAAKVLADRADYLEDAVKWGGSKQYLAGLKGGAIELRHARNSILALIEGATHD